MSDFSFAYGLAWAPGTGALTLDERLPPLVQLIFTLGAQVASIGIIGPDELAESAESIVITATKAGLSGSFEADLVRVLTDRLFEFENEARRLLRPIGQKNGRKWLGGTSGAAPDQSELPSQ